MVVYREPRLFWHCWMFEKIPPPTPQSWFEMETFFQYWEILSQFAVCSFPLRLTCQTVHICVRYSCQNHSVPQNSHWVMHAIQLPKRGRVGFWISLFSCRNVQAEWDLQIETMMMKPPLLRAMKPPPPTPNTPAFPAHRPVPALVHQ